MTITYVLEEVTTNMEEMLSVSIAPHSQCKVSNVVLQEEVLFYNLVVGEYGVFGLVFNYKVMI